MSWEDIKVDLVIREASLACPDVVGSNPAPATRKQNRWQIRKYASGYFYGISSHAPSPCTKYAPNGASSALRRARDEGLGREQGASPSAVSGVVSSAVLSVCYNRREGPACRPLHPEVFGAALPQGNPR